MATFNIAVNSANDKAFYLLRGALFRLEKDAKDEARDLAQKLAADVRDRLKATANPGVDKRQKMLADSITVKRDVTPVIVIGGSGDRFARRRVYRMSQGKRRSRQVSPYVGESVYGVEFGATQNFLRNGGRAFGKRTPRNGRGNRGNWIFPTLTEMQPYIRRRWFAEMDGVLRKWDN